MTQETENEVNDKALLDAVMNLSARFGALEHKMNAIPHARHNLEHDWIKLDMERKQAQRDFWIDIHKRLATTTIIGAFGLLISALGFALVQWIISIKPGS